MAYDTKGIVLDKDGNPIPQYFNSSADEYEVIQGANGKMFVRASELETLLSAIAGHVDGLEGAMTTLNAKDFATQTTLASILTQLDTTGLKKIIDALPAGTNILGKVGIDQTTPGTTNLVQIGGSVTGTHSTSTVGTSSGSVLASNSSRKYALFINDSDTVIYLKVGGAASLNQGIRLNANGGSYEMSANIGNLMTGAVYGISSAASKNLLVLEGA